MPRVRITVAACLGVLALSALASAPASAAGWMVNGTALSGSQALATTAPVDESSVIKGAGVTITCSGKTFNGATPQIESTNKGSAADFEFTECKASSPCTLEGKTIKTEAVTLEATLEGTEAVLAKLKPKTGTLFATIGFEGAECAIEGCQPVSGTAKVLAPTGQKERTWQRIEEIQTANGEFKVGSGSAELSGSALLKLANGEPWSLL